VSGGGCTFKYDGNSCVVCNGVMGIHEHWFDNSLESAYPKEGEVWEWVKCDVGCTSSGSCWVGPCPYISSLDEDSARFATRACHLRPVNFGKG
jgi:hypothetical protein